MTSNQNVKVELNQDSSKYEQRIQELQSLFNSFLPEACTIYQDQNNITPEIRMEIPNSQPKKLDVIKFDYKKLPDGDVFKTKIEENQNRSSSAERNFFFSHLAAQYFTNLRANADNNVDDKSESRILSRVLSPTKQCKFNNINEFNMVGLIAVTHIDQGYLNNNKRNDLKAGFIISDNSLSGADYVKSIGVSKDLILDDKKYQILKQTIEDFKTYCKLYRNGATQNNFNNIEIPTKTIEMAVSDFCTVSRENHALFGYRYPHSNNKNKFGIIINSPDGYYTEHAKKYLENPNLVSYYGTILNEKSDFINNRIKKDLVKILEEYSVKEEDIIINRSRDYENGMGHKFGCSATTIRFDKKYFNDENFAKNFSTLLDNIDKSVNKSIKLGFRDFSKTAKNAAALKQHCEGVNLSYHDYYMTDKKGEVSLRCDDQADLIGLTGRLSYIRTAIGMYAENIGRTNPNYGVVTNPKFFESNVKIDTTDLSIVISDKVVDILLATNPKQVMQKTIGDIGAYRNLLAR